MASSSKKSPGKRAVDRSRQASNPASSATRARRVSKEVSAMGWIEDPFGAVLLVRQKRGKKLWSLPGGKIEGHESLKEGLIREISEETSLEVKWCKFHALFDRPEKSNITLLFRVLIRPGKDAVPQASEIAEIAYRSTLPKNSTPSLQYFWRLMHTSSRSGF